MVYVAECRPVLRRLLVDGGGAVVIRDHNTHHLFHHPVLHRAPQSLPWPLSLMQPHLIQYTVHAGNNFEDPYWDELKSDLLQDWRYNKPQINQAIRHFLISMDPDDTVFIDYF